MHDVTRFEQFQVQPVITGRNTAHLVAAAAAAGNGDDNVNLLDILNYLIAKCTAKKNGYRSKNAVIHAQNDEKVRQILIDSCQCP